MLVSEHDSIVEHLEKQNTALFVQTETLAKELRTVRGELAKYKLQAAKVGKGW